MARRTQEVTITLDNRDKGKVFLLTELPAEEAEEWATRAILALANKGIEIPDEVLAAPSLAGIAFVGTRSLGRIDPDDAIPLFKKMMSCVKIIPDLNNRSFARPIMEGDAGDIEEVTTRVFLRGEVISLHLGFSLLGAIKTMREEMARKMAEKPQKGSGRTKTSRRR